MRGCAGDARVRGRCAGDARAMRGMRGCACDARAMRVRLAVKLRKGTQGVSLAPCRPFACCLLRRWLLLGLLWQWHLLQWHLLQWHLLQWQSKAEDRVRSACCRKWAVQQRASQLVVFFAQSCICVITSSTRPCSIVCDRSNVTFAAMNNSGSGRLPPSAQALR